MTETLIDLSDYRRHVTRANYRCGHHADFKGNPPGIGEFMVCMKCMADTYVESVERGVKVGAPRHVPFVEEWLEC